MITTSTVAAVAMAASMGSAIVVQDQASLRSAPRQSAQQQTTLWQGEVLEVRGERMDYLQVWDHKRERGGFIRASEVRRVALTEDEAPALLAVLRLCAIRRAQRRWASASRRPGCRRRPVRCWQAARGAGPGGAGHPGRPAGPPGLGRGAWQNPGATLSAHLDVAQGYGVRFVSYAVEGACRSATTVKRSAACSPWRRPRLTSAPALHWA